MLIQFPLAFLLLALSLSTTLAYDWTPPTNKVVLLAINTHPDDEGIFFGGVLPYYSAVLKVPTILLSVTSGDWKTNNLLVREEELRCAAWTYGLPYEPLFPRFKDVPSQSLANNPYTNSTAQPPYTNTIDATWDYWADGILQGGGGDVEAGKQNAINSVAEQIRRYRPDVIVTHDYKGEYGHDNHKAVAFVVTNAFYRAADPAATATNLAGLPPWQAKKLYLHLWPTNRLFHISFETPFAELTNRTPRQLADLGLDCHVSQNRPDVSTVYRAGENYDPYPCEWWGLYASTVGPDTLLPANTTFRGYPVPAGVAAGNFLEHILPAPPNRPPSFTNTTILTAAAFHNQPFSATLADSATDSDLAWSDSLRYEKLFGPPWLQVAPDGALSGIPSADIGTNTFLVAVTDSSGLQDQAALLIPVLPASSPMDNLAAWWKLDETNGATAYDSAPPARNGSSFAGVTPGADPAAPFLGRSAFFDGTTNAKIDVAFAPALNSPAFTLACWARVTGGAGTYRSAVTSRENAPQSGCVLYAGQNNIWQLWIGTGTAWKILSAGPVISNTWIHLAGTYDGARLAFYTNGVLAAASNFLFRANTRFPLRIGAGATETNGLYWFNGYLDDVRVYNAALPAPDISALYSNHPPAFASDPFARPDATPGAPYAAQPLAASDPDPADALRYEKLAGPAWLNLALDGTLSGTPGANHSGLASFLVRAVDRQGATATATLQITVLPAPPVPPAFTALTPVAGGLQLRGTGIIGQAYILLTSTNLRPTASWTPVSTNTADPSGHFLFTQPLATNAPARFYRAAAPR